MRQLLTRNSRPSVWDLMSEVEKAFEQNWSSEREDVTRTDFMPRMDIRETAENYLLSADLPGVNKNQIKIDFHQGRLTISGERSLEKKSDTGSIHRIERQFGRFERAFQLPSDVDESRIQARHEDGVLEILIPKSEVAKPKTIAIDTEKKGLFSKLLGNNSSNTEPKSSGH